MGEQRTRRGRGRRLKTSLDLSDPPHVAQSFPHLRSPFPHPLSGPAGIAILGSLH